MTKDGIFLLGALLSWAGAVALGAAIWSLVQAVIGSPSYTRESRLARTGIFALIGAVVLFAGGRLAQSHDWAIAIVWVVLPFAGWFTIAAFVVSVLRLISVSNALNTEERTARLKSAAVWILSAVLGFIVYWRTGEPPLVIHGQIELGATSLEAMVALLIGGAALTSLAAKDLVVRAGFKAAALQITLLLGTVVFGMPFAWLLITSFKEDRDMASPNGIILVPRVERTVPYLDPKNPTVEAKYDGQNVQASVLRKNPDGSVDLDIIRPFSLHGRSLTAARGEWKEIPRDIPLVKWTEEGTEFGGKVIEELPDGRRRISVMTPASSAGKELVKNPVDVQPDRHIGLRFANYTDSLEYLPAETNRGLVYLKNTLVIVIFSVIGAILSSTMVAYAFARIRFPGREFLFTLLLATMMLPGAVTLLPQFLIFRSLGWINTLLPIIVPTFFASAFNVFLLRQFLKQVPGELEDAAKIDGCNHGKILTKIMVPAIMPALAVIAIWTFMGAWNNFMGPLIYLSTPENMPLSYALQLFQGERQGQPGLLMAFTTMTMMPVLLLFFFAQKYFVEGVTLSGLGGR